MSVSSPMLPVSSAGCANGSHTPLAAALLAALAAACCAAPAAGADPGGHRWAIVATPDVQQTGLVDLLTVELSKLDGVELVERAQLDAAMKELELTALFGAGAAGGRLKLGRVLGADVLVLLSRKTSRLEAPAESKQFLQAVLCDCTCGARLRVEHLPEEGDPAPLAEKIAGVVQQVRRQFKHGLRAVIGVPPFVSRNLTHDFDRLQTGYAEVVEAALSSHPGVAVVEIEEARAVAAELQRTGADLKQRPVPVCVEGQFKMSTLKMEPDTQVHLAIRVTDGGVLERHARAGPLSPQQAVDFLSGSMARGVLRIVLNEPCQGLSADDQFRLLTARADTFAALGDWRRSTDLREAALLLKPDDAEQALRSVAEMLLLLMPPTNDTSFQFKGTGHARSAADQRDCQARWGAMLGHVESVIGHRQVNPREAHLLVCLARQSADHLAGVGPEPWRKEDWREFQQIGDLWRQPKPPEVRQRLDQFFRQVYPMFPRLDPAIGSGTIRELIAPAILAGYHKGDDSAEVSAECRKEMSAADQYALWSGAMLWNVHAAAATSFSTYGTREDRPLSDGYLRGGRHYDTRYYYDTVFWLLTNVELRPFSIHPFRNAKALAPDYRLRIAGCPVVSAPAPEGSPIPRPPQEEGERVEQFLVALEGTGRPDLVFLAGSMRLLYADEQFRRDVTRFRREHGEREPFSSEISARFEGIDKRLSDLSDLVKANGYESSQPPPFWDPVAGLEACRSGLVGYREFARLKVATGRKPKDRRPQLSFAPDRLETEPFDVAFEPIEGIHGQYGSLVNCGTWDVLYHPTISSKNLLVIREKDLAEELFAVQPGDCVLNAAFDGRGLWLATRNNGIRVLDAHGRTLASWTSEDGLPEYENRLTVYPWEPGRCLVIGLYGAEGSANPRTWFAVLEHREGGPQPIRIFHTATKVADDADTADQGFVPMWIAPWRQSNAPEKPLLLVGRSNGTPKRIPDQWQRRPLIVDLQTLDIAVSPGRFPAVNPKAQTQEFAVIDGPRILIPAGRWFYVVRPPSEGSDRWTWRCDPPGEERYHHYPISSVSVFAWQGRLISRGVGTWWSFDGKTGAPQSLAPSPGSPAFPIGVSAHYGLVAIRDGRLHRVRIGPGLSETERTDQVYSHVPAQLRQGHAAAVQAIRELGGSVGRVYPSQYENSHGAYLGALLDKNWRGGDKGLAHLRDLHDLRFLYLVECPVTGAAVDSIGQCKTLESLVLYETGITDADLAPLAKLDTLRRLRLEGTTGGKEFTDAALQELTHLRLEKLVLYGKGFTLKSLEVLAEMPALKQLYLYDAAIPLDRIKPWKEKKKLEVFCSFD